MSYCSRPYCGQAALGLLPVLFWEERLARRFHQLSRPLFQTSPSANVSLREYPHLYLELPR
jgi:hypothetical protein